MCCALAFGCSEEKEESKPANLLSDKQLTSILIDMHIAEARVEAVQIGVEAGAALDGARP